MPKKKKPAANPGRGFATTSVASKPKPEKSISDTDSPATSKDASKDATGDATGAASPAVNPSNNNDSTTSKDPAQSLQQANGAPAANLHELSPEELEKRLEEADLQSFVDRHQPKSARDSSRCISKLQTDCRLLRAQAQPLSTRGLLPDDLVLKLVGLARDDVNQGRQDLDDSRPRSLPPEDDLTARLWTLQSTLLGLGFSDDQIDAVLAYVLRFPPATSSDALVWGLDEAFDWLCCNLNEEDLPVFDSQTGKPVAARLDASDPDSQALDEDTTPSDGPVETPAKPQSKTTRKPAIEDDEDVSDLGSDLEPDELLSSYLKVKTRLYEIDPDFAPAPAKPAKKNKKHAPKPPAPKQKPPNGPPKLLDKLRKIESDALFDQFEADLQWANHRILLAREEYERKKMQLPAKEPEEKIVKKEETANGVDPPKKAEKAEASDEESSSDETASDEDDTALADLFAALPSDQPALDADAPQPDYQNMQIRDFGPTKGLEPRRILEETCKARDSSVKLNFRLVSTTAFSNRHAVFITWSRGQRFQFPLASTSFESSQKGRQVSFTMMNVSTPDAQQSMQYISVFALFQLFSTSSREEKAYLRLPPNWRTQWFELADAAKSQSEARERVKVQKLREIVSSHFRDHESDDDIIFTKNFKKRNAEATQRDSQPPAEPTLTRDEDTIKNIWLDKSSTPQFQQFLEIRSNLPMWRFKDLALDTVDQNQVTIICGETGCGKSTQMPSFILEHALSQGKHCKIYCTEPRRISAVTLAQRVSEELGEGRRDVGTPRSLVGHAIRLESKMCATTRLVYATTGVVLRMLENPAGLADVSHVVIDEVHERSIETDFLLIILRALCARRPDLKVVLMSATVDADRFAKYFGGAPVLNVPGRTFPVATKFIEDAVELTGYVVDDDDGHAVEEDDDDAAPDEGANTSTGTAYLQAYSKKTRDTLAKMNHYNIDYGLIVRLVESIASSDEYQKYSRAVLIFLPGIAEIRRLNDMLSGSWLGKRYVVHSLHSSVASEDQQAAFALPPRGLGKIVIATNIAETGITIPDITCVIDGGQHKEMRFDERRQISRLLNCAISRANAKQRRGRAGRVQEGLCFHLFGRQRHDEALAPQQTPEMLRLSLQDLIVRVKVCRLGDISATLADALDPPLPRNIRRAIDALVEAGALTPAEDLTPLGAQLARLPLDPYLGKLVLYGAVFGCLDACATLAATLTSKSAFAAPLGARKQADAARAAFRTRDSDLLTEYSAYCAWRRVCTGGAAGGVTEAQFCRRNFLSAQNLAGTEDLKAQLLAALADAGLARYASPDERRALSRVQNSAGGSRRRAFAPVPAAQDSHSGNGELVAAVIAWAFYPKLLARDGRGWRNVASAQAVAVHPTSVLRLAPGPGLAAARFLSFYSILQSGAGARSVNALALTPAAGFAVLLLAGAAAFHPVAHVVSVDGARVRFAVDAPRQRVGAGEGAVVVGVWKTGLALRFLRRRLEDAMRRRWRKPEERMPPSLAAWLDVWELVVAHWSGLEG